MERIIIDQDQVALGVECACDNCDWRADIRLSVPCEDAILTPGDEVPAGRCPECEGLVYVVKP
jgi:hypothetical protein